MDSWVELNRPGCGCEFGKGADNDEQLSPKNICLSVPPGEVRILQLSL